MCDILTRTMFSSSFPAKAQNVFSSILAASFTDSAGNFAQEEMERESGYLDVWLSGK